MTNQGTQLDRAGRVGVAVSADSDNGTTRDTLIFNAETGVLLSYERDAIPSAQSKTQSPNVTTLRLYLDQTYVDNFDNH
jgi:hypothetical protein